MMTVSLVYIVFQLATIIGTSTWLASMCSSITSLFEGLWPLIHVQTCVLWLKLRKIKFKFLSCFSLVALILIRNSVLGLERHLAAVWTVLDAELGEDTTEAAAESSGGRHLNHVNHRHAASTSNICDLWHCHPRGDCLLCTVIITFVFKKYWDFMK